MLYSGEIFVNDDKSIIVFEDFGLFLFVFFFYLVV